MKIYISHCSAKKEESLKYSKEEVYPFKLYTATPLKRFMKECQQKQVDWAILSDFYGIWFPNEKYIWYEKSPNKVSKEEFNLLLDNLNKRLSIYNEIWFYYNPGRFHQLYKKILNHTKLKNRIKMFTHLREIQ